MRLSRFMAGASWLACLLASIAAPVAAADETPATVKRHVFDHDPTSFSYFEDSNVILMLVRDAGLLRISVSGGDKWGFVEETSKAKDIIGLFMHPYDKKSAIAIGRGNKHWATFDRAKTWVPFTTEGVLNTDGDASPFSWHASDPKKIIVHNLVKTERYPDHIEAYYTEDGFESDLEPLMERTSQCSWAKETMEFESEKDGIAEKRIFCVVPGPTSSPDTRPRAEDFRLVYSDDYFASDERREVRLDGDRPLPGVTHIVSSAKFLLVARKPAGSNEMALYTSDDGDGWHRTLFTQQQVEYGGYTVLESSNHSIRLNVLLESSRAGESNFGRLFQSNSAGNFFTRSSDDIYTNVGPFGFVDFEKAKNIEGVLLVNAVANAEEVATRRAEKQIVSKISFDDGRSFQDLVLIDRDGDKKHEHLHLHSVTRSYKHMVNHRNQDTRNVGAVFSSPAPGLMMGVGNTGKSLRDWDECDTFVSDDAGETWRLALKGPHFYEFGDSGSVLVAVYARGSTNRIMYNYHHGQGDWKQLAIETGDKHPKFVPQVLTTMPDNTGRRFLLEAKEGTGKDTRNVVYTIDFGTPEKPKCKDSDFEEWSARVDPETHEAGCVMGHKQVFRRRKADATCFVSDLYNEPLPDQSQVCECSINDYECDYGFIRDKEDKTKCVPTQDFKPLPRQCDNGQEEFDGASGYRKIPGNTCEGGKKLDEPKKWPCKGAGKAPVNDGEIRVEMHEFLVKDADKFGDYRYLERSVNDDFEVVMMTLANRLFTTKDHGDEWIPRDSPEELGNDEVTRIIRNQYESNHAYFITAGSKVFYTKDRTDTIKSFDAPCPPRQDGPPLRFHESNSNWLIWLGCKKSGRVCEPVTYYTTRGIEEWRPMLPGAINCEFVYRKDRTGIHDDEKRVLCAAHADENVSHPLQLLSSADFFETSETLYDDILNFATMSEFVIVAKRDADKNDFLSIDASANGQDFANAKFPHGSEVDHQTAFTVLDSSTHSIFLHVTVNPEEDREYGSILKSNSNGTYYAKALDYVNRDSRGFVDFEKMLSIEGLSFLNQVSNPKEVDQGARKKLRTLASHNDGSEWNWITPPDKDNEGTDYMCGDSKKVPQSRIAECSLNLHTYTERRDARDTLSSPSAVGIVIAVGNVGASLEPKKRGDTFISNDGGLHWKTAMKGQFQWEFGDQGSIIVLVAEDEPTDILYYSLDRGDTWLEKEFSKHKVRVLDITTTPQDGSRKFLLWAVNNKGNPTTYTVDFSGLTDRRCKLPDADTPLDKSDYEEFVPRHPFMEASCLFGHRSVYYRKKNNAQCYNGSPIEHPLSGAQDACECTRSDFECDYNYEREGQGGQCVKVQGLPDRDPQEVCKEEGRFEYFAPTGYRKIPLDTCQGGRELDQWLGTSKPCPGHEAEWQDRHRGISGVGLFFAITMPLLAAAGIGYFVWTRYGSQIGRIRLGEGGGGARSFDTNSPIIAWPIAIVSAVAAMAMAIPAVLGSVIRGVRERFGGRGGGRFGGRYTSRSSFARSRGTYAAVGNEELETDLLGDESDEE